MLPSTACLIAALAASGLPSLTAPAGTPAGPLAAGPAPAAPADLPLVVVDADDTVIDASCRVRIPPGLVLRDAGEPGVIQVRSDGVTLVFEPGSVLRGADDDTPGDELTGVGVHVSGAFGVTLRGARLAGYRVGVLAQDTEWLELRDVHVLSGFRRRLSSTVEQADDGADWLAPHHNDAREWVTRDGAGLCVERSRGVTVQGCRVRDAQNGLILDRVDQGLVAFNDCSYLSGWGLAMWRASGLDVFGNAFDFCVRGASHGVYNRGQDSAGLLMFESCVDNTIHDNSITHGGDGVFAFSGVEALGEAGGRPGDHAGRGHRGNRFEGNDLSFAAAHGLELTFAQANTIRANRFEGNAICGVWGGYSQGLVIEGNHFADNGEAGYGAERGGVNIEHGRENVITGNRFEDDLCGVRLWWDADEHLAGLPWVVAHDGGACADNLVEGNAFVRTPVAVELQHCDGTVVAGNAYTSVDERLVRTSGADLTPTEDASVAGDPVTGPDAAPHLAAMAAGRARMGSGGDDRSGRRGREHIVMTEWGPWDHARPAWQVVRRLPAERVVRALGVDLDAAVTLSGEGVVLERGVDRLPSGDEVLRLGVRPADGADGALPYVLTVDGLPTRRGTLLATDWTLTCFATTADPREDAAAFRAAAEAPDAVTVTSPRLRLDFGAGGPSDLGLDPALDEAGLPRDGFGTVARSELRLPAGRWRLTTLSDDGIRVRVDGETVIDDWTWHGPTPHEALIERLEAGTAVIEVEHFELDGWSVLRVALEPAD